MRACALTCMRVSVLACMRAYSSRVKCHSRGGKIARWTVREFFYDRFLRPHRAFVCPSLSPANPAAFYGLHIPVLCRYTIRLGVGIQPLRRIAVRLSFSRSVCFWRIWCSRYDMSELHFLRLWMFYDTVMNVVFCLVWPLKLFARLVVIKATKQLCWLSETNEILLVFSV